MRRPIMDPSKAPCAAVTMVRGDYFFLRRWIDYYSAQFGLKHLYVLNHGNDPEVRRIAAGATVIHVPYDEYRTKVDSRRWELISHFTSGLLRYYAWVLCGDVDEYVVVDPEVAPGLLPYITSFPERQTPAVICPLGIEIIHNPVLEPEPLADDLPILARRRLFRLNANYSKPCLIRTPVSFSPGGHSCSHNDRTVDPHLFLVHMRFVSHDLTLARLQSRVEMKKLEAQMLEAQTLEAQTPHAEAPDAKTPDAETPVAAAPRRATWTKDAESYLRLAKLEPVAETVDFAAFRQIMVEQKKEVRPGSHWFFGGGRSKVLYRLPDRFTHLI